MPIKLKIALVLIVVFVPIGVLFYFGSKYSLEISYLTSGNNKFDQEIKSTSTETLVDVRWGLIDAEDFLSPASDQLQRFQIAGIMVKTYSDGAYQWMRMHTPSGLIDIPIGNVGGRMSYIEALHTKDNIVSIDYDNQEHIVLEMNDFVEFLTKEIKDKPVVVTMTTYSTQEKQNDYYYSSIANVCKDDECVNRIKYSQSHLKSDFQTLNSLNSQSQFIYKKLTLPVGQLLIE